MQEIQISMQEGRGRQGKAPMRLNSVLLLLLAFSFAKTWDEDVPCIIKTNFQDALLERSRLAKQSHIMQKF